MRKESWGEYKKGIIDLFIEKVRTSKIIGDIKSHSVILDLGCGYEATFLNLISNKIKKGVGLDISVTPIKTSANITLIKGKVDQDIKLNSNQFDNITALATIEHVKNPNKMIKESYRLLKKGGVLSITTPSKYSKPILEFLAFKLKLISATEISDHKRYYDKNTLRDVLTQNGFKENKIEIEYFELGVNILARSTK